MNDVNVMLSQMVDGLEGFKARVDADLNSMGRDLADLQLKGGRPNLGGGRSDPGDTKRLRDALTQFARTGDQQEIKALATNDDPGGGYMMVPEWDQSVRLIRDRVSPMSALCREVTLRQGAELLLPFSRSVLTGTWVAESSARSETTAPDFGMHRIPLRENYVCPAVSQLLLDTAGYDVAQVLLDQIGHGLASTEATSLHSGDGVARPMGLLSYTTSSSSDASRTLGQIQYTPTGASGAWAAAGAADCLITALGELAPQYQNGDTRWLMNQATAASLRNLKTASGDYMLWQPGLQPGQPASLLGIPIVIDNAMPAISAGSYSIAVGDLKQAFCVVRGGGLRLIRDNLTSKGSVLFYAFSRIGGGLIDDRAVKLIKFAAS